MTENGKALKYIFDGNKIAAVRVADLVGNGKMTDVCPEFMPLLECPQRPDYHAEGSAYRHTLLVMENLAFMCAPVDWRLMAAAFFHDIGKPSTTTINPKTGYPRHLGHDIKGAKMTAEILEREGFNPIDKQLIVNLVEQHMNVHNLEQMKRKVEIWLYIQKAINFDYLLKLADADTKGSIGCGSLLSADWGVDLDMYQRSSLPDRQYNICDISRDIKSLIVNTRKNIDNEVANALNIGYKRQLSVYEPQTDSQDGLVYMRPKEGVTEHSEMKLARASALSYLHDKGVIREWK